NWGRALLSEQYPEIWLFFQGALFLIVVTVLPDGIVGWLRYRAADDLRSLFGKPIPTATYPRLEVDESIRQEAELYGKPHAAGSEDTSAPSNPVISDPVPSNIEPGETPQP
ncbi:MAG: urea ABC transporter permease subunit UrtC, partial [Cyanobacteria bacterium J06554_11]